MLKPPSIRTFEGLYLGSIVLWALNTVIFWSRNQAMMASNPQFVANPQMVAIIQPIMIATVAITAVLSLLFWYLVARRASVVGKWMVVVTEAIGAIFLLLGLVRLATTGGVTAPVALGFVATVLAVAAAAMLFRPDTNAWFAIGEDYDPVDPAATAGPLP